jgi:hypothetical protein
MNATMASRNIVRPRFDPAACGARAMSAAISRKTRGGGDRIGRIVEKRGCRGNISLDGLAASGPQFCVRKWVLAPTEIL